jgi:hypothetical protein
MIMKNYQEYVYDLNKVYKYRVKIAGVNPKGDVMERIKNALNAYDLDTVSTPKSIPIQEHSEFPRMGPCECWIFEIAIKYPTTSEHLRYLIKERAAIRSDWICVLNLNEDQFNTEFEAYGKDHDGQALLNEPEMKAAEGGQELAGQKRVDSLLKELTTRKYEFDKPSKTVLKSTDDLKVGDNSAMGSTQNTIPDPTKKAAK